MKQLERPEKRRPVLAAGLVTALALGLAAGPAMAENDFGAGLVFGETNGLSLKGYVDSRHAIGAGVDYSLIDDALNLHVGYLIHFAWMGEVGMRPGASRAALLPYVGIGGFMAIRDEPDGVGLRVPLGVAWQPPTAPIDVFVELAPRLALAPETDAQIGAALGVRYFF